MPKTKIQAALTGCDHNSNCIFVSQFVVKPVQVGVLLPVPARDLGRPLHLSRDSKVRAYQGHLDCKHNLNSRLKMLGTHRCVPHRRGRHNKLPWGAAA